ncbi:serine/threonine protein kinase [Lusitaniella coriacea]|uniref:serine/threonine protein kinase n=1 Tax=Lusitaniella coriacea TaxID=1983105 RepID=UPI003CF1D913
MEAQSQPENCIAERYRILGTLGEGGTGITYVAQDLQSGQKVALKALVLRNITDWKVLELFEREARILSQLNHPAIPRYLDSFQVDTEKDRVFYLVQHLAPGQSLYAWVNNGLNPNSTQVQGLAEKILEILVYLQDFTPPIIHRDLKPQNIIRHPKKGIFLVDFGAVQDTYRHTVTRGSTVVGTYGYMAPEQFRGHADLSTDLYGLGTTLLFLLTGKSPAELPRKQLKIQFRSHINADKAFGDWLERMLEPASEERFSSAKEALAVLRGEQPLPPKIKPAQKPRIPSKSPISIDLNEEKGELKIEIPPIGLRSDRAQNFAILTFIWSGVLVLMAWAIVTLSLVLSPANYLWFGLFVAIGLWMLRAFLYSDFSRTRIEADAQTFQLQQWLWGMRHQKIRFNTKDITEAQLSLLFLPFPKEPLTVCEVRTRSRKVRFGALLPASEKKWLIRELTAFLKSFPT